MGNTCGGDDDLPLFSEGVFFQILLWLPVVSLLRFKSVCKSWHALIQSSFFIDLHTATTFNSSSSSSFCSSSRFDTFILQAFAPSDNDDYVGGQEIKMVGISLRSGTGSGGGGCTTGEEDDDDVDELVKFYDLGFSSCYKDFLLCISQTLMVSSCNGLICLYDNANMNVYLWNPATRQFRILPKSITIEINEGIWIPLSNFVAFGFDVKTKDYKVVKFSPFLKRGVSVPVPGEGESWDGSVPREGGWIYRVQVYSLSTDSWRFLEGIYSLPILPYRLPFAHDGKYLNGCYFFVGKVTKKRFLSSADGSIIPICNNCLMLSFDFAKEIFTTMQLPDHDSRHELVVLSYLGEKLALFASKRSSVSLNFLACEDYEYDIWVLKNNEHGSGSGSSVNKESWTKLHSFRLENQRGTSTHPRCILKDFALISANTSDSGDEKLQLVNLVTKEVKMDFLIDFGMKVCRVDVYKESLVSIIGGKCSSSS